MNKSAGPPILNEVCFLSSSFKITVHPNLFADSIISKYSGVMVFPPFYKTDMQKLQIPYALLNFMIFGFWVFHSEIYK